MNIKHNNTLQPGFNFIEMMIVIVIIGILASMVGPKVFKLLSGGKKVATQNTLNVIKTGIQSYKMDTSVLPESLQDLMKKPEGVSGWDGPYAGEEDNTGKLELKKDEWGGDIIYKKNPKGTTPAFELYSTGDPEKEDDRIYAK